MITCFEKKRHIDEYNEKHRERKRKKVPCGNERPSRNSLNTSSCCSQIYFGFGVPTRQRKKNKTGQIRESERVRLIRDRRYITAYVYPFDGRMAALRDKPSSPSFRKKSRVFTRALVLTSRSLTAH